jgi:DHA1 family bicyclomycin/chloramphenicol resistance-like MFS transporter
MKNRLLIPILAALSMMGALSIDAYLPAIPAIGHDFAASPAAVQQTLTVYLVAFAFMSLFYGTLSDSFGRRPVLLYSLACYFVSSIGAAFAPSLGWLLFFRMLQGFCAGSGSVIARAIVGDLFSGADAQKMMSYIFAVFGLAPAIAPILGGWILVEWGWRSIFFVIALFTFFLWLAIYFLLSESLKTENRHSFQFRDVVSRYIEVGSHARFMCRTVSAALSFFGIMLYVSSAPAYIINLLHLTEKDFGWLFVPFIGGMMIGSVASARLSHKIKPFTLIFAGNGLMALSVTASMIYSAFFVIEVPWAVIPHFFLGFGAAICNPAMTVITLEMFPNVKGLPSSMQGFTFMVIFSIISGCIVPLLFSSAFLLAVGSAIGLALSIFLWWVGSIGEKEHAVFTKDEDALAEEASHL